MLATSNLVRLANRIQSTPEALIQQFDIELLSSSAQGDVITVAVKSKADSTFKGSIEMKMTRRDLTKVFHDVTPSLRSTVIADSKRISDLAPLLQRKYGIAITKADLIDGPLPQSNEITITASPLSIEWYGQLTVLIRE